MANVTVTTSNPSITVDSTNSIITVNQTDSNVVVGEVSVVTVPTNLVTANGTFGTLNVGNTSTTQYTFPIDAPTEDQGLRAYANGTLYWSADVGLVDSVNGQTGDVVLTTTNINEGTNLYYTDARVDSRLSSGSVATIQTSGNITSGSHFVGNNLFASSNTLVLGTSTGTSSVDTVQVKPGINYGSRLLVGDETNIPYGNFAGGHTGESLGVGGILSVDAGLYFGGRYLYVGADQHSDFSTWNSDTTPGNVRINFGLGAIGTDNAAQYGSILASRRNRYGTTDYSMKMGWVDNNEGSFDQGAFIPFSDLADTKVATTFTDNVTVEGTLQANSNISTTQHIITNNITPLTGNTITVAGNMEVEGNLNVVEKVDLLLQDNKIVLNYGNVTARDAFITVDRSGSSLANAQLKWNETDDRFEFSDHTKFEDNIRVTAKDSQNPKIIFNKGASGADSWIQTSSSTVGSGLYTNEHGIVLNTDYTTHGNVDGGLGINKSDGTGVYVLWNATDNRWTFTNDGSTYHNLFVDGDAISSSNVTVTDTLKVDTIDNNTGSNIVMNANVIVGVNPTGSVIANVYASTAITSIISRENSGRPADILTLSGHGSQVFSDGTYIEVEGIINSGATEINDSSPYYTKWNIHENGYELYEDSGLVTPAHPATTDVYINPPAGSPVVKNVTGTTTTTTYGPANLYLSGNIDSGNITNSGIITTTNSKTTTLSQTAEARPINLTDKYKITADNIQLSQTGVEGSAPNSQGGSIGDGVFKYGELQWEGLEATDYNRTLTHSSNVIPEAYNIIYNATAGSTTLTITGYGGMKDFNFNSNTNINTNDISGFIQSNIRTGQVITQEADPVGTYGVTGFNEKPLYVVSTDHANSTITLNDVADANITGDTVNGITNRTYLTVSEGVYNSTTGLRAVVLDGEWISTPSNPKSNVDLGFFAIPSTNRKNHNVEFDLDDLSYSAGLYRQDFSMTGNNLLTGRSYWKMGKSTLAGDTYQDESTFRAPRGIVIGNETELGNRPFRDGFEVNGLNIGWDGKAESLGFNHATKNLPVTQVGLGAFTDFSAQNELGNFRSQAGPRLMFSSFEGDVDTPLSLQYPRAGTEIGRVMAWGRSQNLSSPSTYNPSSKLSFYAVDYEGTNKTTDFVLSKATGSTVRQHIATDSDFQNSNKSSTSLHLSGGEVYLGPLENNTTAQNRAPLQKYAVARTVEATGQGSALYAFSGHNASVSNDIELGLFRNGNAFANVTINVDRGEHNQRGTTATQVQQNFYAIGTVSAGDAVRSQMNAKQNTYPADFANGDEVLLDGFSGSFGTAVNGNTYYAKLDYGLIFTLYTDSGLTTGLNTGVATNTNIDENKTATITFINRGAKYVGGAHRMYSWFLPSNSDDLFMYKDGSNSGTQLWRYDSANTNFNYGSIGIHADTFTGNLTGNVTGTVSDISNHQNYIRTSLGAHNGISYDNSTGLFSLSDTDLISGVTAGSGLTGGGDTGNVTLDIGAGNGITVNADNVAVDMSVFSTTDLTEGTNLYYTDTRADARVNLQTGSNLDLSNKSTSDLSEGTNLYYTDARADARVNLQTGSNLDISSKDTDDLSEGSSNLYYTDARVDARLNSGSVASISADDITLKQFQETVISHGNQSGDISSTLDLANGSIFKLTATGAITINSIANAAAGSSGVIIITQDGTGSRALTTGANIKWAGGLNTLSTTPAEVDIINFFYDGSVYYFALSKGYA